MNTTTCEKCLNTAKWCACAWEMDAPDDELKAVIPYRLPDPETQLELELELLRRVM